MSLVVHLSKLSRPSRTSGPSVYRGRARPGLPRISTQCRHRWLALRGISRSQRKRATPNVRLIRGPPSSPPRWGGLRTQSSGLRRFSSSTPLFDVLPRWVVRHAWRQSPRWAPAQSRLGVPCSCRQLRRRRRAPAGSRGACRLRPGAHPGRREPRWAPCRSARAGGRAGRAAGRGLGDLAGLHMLELAAGQSVDTTSSLASGRWCSSSTSGSSSRWERCWRSGWSSGRVAVAIAGTLFSLGTGWLVARAIRPDPTPFAQRLRRVEAAPPRASGSRRAC